MNWPAAKANRVLAALFRLTDSREEAVALIREAIELHIDSLREHGEPVPSPSATVETVVVHTAA